MDQKLRSESRLMWACTDRDYAPIHMLPSPAVPRFKDLRVRAMCGAWLHPAAIWSTDPGMELLKHHGCKKCNAKRGDA